MTTLTLKTDKRHKAAQLALADILGVAYEDLPFVFKCPHKRALKVGIDKDLRERFPKAPESALSLWMAKWTGSTSYLERLSTGTNRHDLDGKECGVIEDSQRSHAIGWLRKRAERKAKEGKQKKAA